MWEKYVEFQKLKNHKQAATCCHYHISLQEGLVEENN
jgi:hypothetical protein